MDWATLARERLQEIESLQLMYEGSGCISIDPDALKQTMFMLDSQDPSCKFPSIQVEISLRPSEAVAEIDETCKLENSSLCLVADMHCSYPQEALRVTLRSDSIPNQDIQEVVSMLKQEAENCAGDQSIFILVGTAETWLQEYQDKMVSIQREYNQSQIRQEHETVASGRPDLSSTFGRRMIWSHHILSSIKRRHIIQWAYELELGGYSKIGYPGLIIVEGPESSCQEYCRRLQHLRWKALVVRGEEQHVLEDCQTMDDLRVFEIGIVEMGPDETSELSALCKEAGLLDLFKSSMKMYS